MLNRLLRFIVVVCILAAGAAPAAADPMRVVTTLSSYADIVKQIGGDQVEVSSVAAPRFNPHFIEPRPSDIARLKRCDLFVHGGLDLEAWRGPLVDAAARTDLRAGGERALDLSVGIRILNVPAANVSRAEGDIHLFGNPHYWIDPRNGVIIARSIATKLSEIQPVLADHFKQNLETFLHELNAKIELWQRALAPYRGQELIGYHDEWVYLMDFAGMTMNQFLETKPGIPPTPRHIDELVDFIKLHRIAGIIQATFYPKDAGQALAERSGARLAFLAQNVGEVPEASNYISFVDYNVAGLIDLFTRE